MAQLKKWRIFEIWTRKKNWDMTYRGKCRFFKRMSKKRLLKHLVASECCSILGGDKSGNFEISVYSSHVQIPKIEQMTLSVTCVLKELELGLEEPFSNRKLPTHQFLRNCRWVENTQFLKIEISTIWHLECYINSEVKYMIYSSGNRFSIDFHNSNIYCS